MKEPNVELKAFSIGYITRLQTALDRVNLEVVESIVEVLEQSTKNGSRIYVLGNGGSAATASHMVNDWGTGLRRRKIINLDITSLADNTPVCTAISNDIGYENVFYMQLVGLLKKEDVVIALSCSGNSPNIIKAVDYANEIGSTVIGITGFDGGQLRRLCDISFHVPSEDSDYGLVEDVHMILDHMIYSYFIEKSLTHGG
jgi:D-sedoheptulose 7-phosphate isomerase